MGQRANCCKQQNESLSEIYSEQINADYFGPLYAPQYQMNTKFITHFQTYVTKVEDQKIGSQIVSTTNHTDQELALNSIKQKEKFLTNPNQIIGSLLDLDSNNVNSSYENSINAKRSILKKKDQKQSQQPKCVKFKNTDSKKKFSVSQQKQLGELLKRKYK